MVVSFNCSYFKIIFVDENINAWQTEGLDLILDSCQNALFNPPNEHGIYRYNSRAT